NSATGLPITKQAPKREDYPKQEVRNYFIYTIALGEYNYDKLNDAMAVAQRLLPPNKLASQTTVLGCMNDDKGFDQEGKMHLKLVMNNDFAPIQINDKVNNRTGGYITTNGIVHVFGATVLPFR